MHDSFRLPALPLWLALLVAFLAACTSGGPPSDGVGGSPGRGVYVPAEWEMNRRVTGHRVHVVEQRVACNRCHELNANALGAVSPVRCKSCHEAEAKIEHAVSEAHARFGSGVQADCLSCHAFTVDSATQALSDAGPIAPFSPKDCARCHEHAQGQTPKVVVHASAPCTSCHKPHVDSAPVSAPCADCHGAISTAHAALGKSANGVCTTCHTRQHATAADARASCSECHAKSQPIVAASALFAGGHERCVSCHRPHEFEARQAVPCRSCHAQVLVLAESKVPAHAQCASCHEPHDVRATPAAACAKCHWDVHTDHPDRNSGAGCVSCHNPHPAREQPQVVARACTSCHQMAGTDHDLHAGVACQKCHTPHHFRVDLAQHDLCQGCHQKELALTALRTGHGLCQSCHEGLPHQPRTPGKACDTCHGEVRREVRTGHQDCKGCHEAHGGGVTTECKTCHLQELSTASVGHRSCTNCHQPHSGATTAAVCANCHAPEAASAHGKVASGCLTCHRPHAAAGVAAPPACVTCHQGSRLPGLHVKPQHQDCERCHTGHGDAPNLERSVCLGCHADRSQHFPGARCANCHLFEGGARGVTAH